MNQEIAEYLKTIICTLAPLEREGITADQDIFLDLGIDSVSALQMLAAIETRYDIRFQDCDLGKYNTIARIVEQVESSLRKAYAEESADIPNLAMRGK